MRRGYTTGANEFFYLDEKEIIYWGIEKEFLEPVIKSPRECKRLILNPNDLKYNIFICHKTKKELEGTAALEYIKWGESQRFHERPTLMARAKWWDIGSHERPTHIWQKSINDRHIQCEIPFNAFVDQRLYKLSFIAKPRAFTTVLNSALLILSKELRGRVNLGEGALDTAVFEANSIEILNPHLLDENDCSKVIKTLSQRDILAINKELKMDDRLKMDTLVFDILKLTSDERDDVYEAVINLVEARMGKASSLKPKELLKRVTAAEKTMGIWSEIQEEIFEEE